MKQYVFNILRVCKRWCYNLASVAAMGVALVAALLTFAGVMHLFAWLLGFTGFVFGVDFGELSAWVKLVIFAVLDLTAALDLSIFVENNLLWLASRCGLCQWRGASVDTLTLWKAPKSVIKMLVNA